MTLRKKFSDDDLQRIKQAVHQAEDKISGEIVPVIVERSGYYSIANYRAGTYTAAALFLLIIIFDRYIPSLAIYDPLLIFVTIVIGGLLAGVAVDFIPFAKRGLLGQRHLDHATRQKAESAFLQEEVFNTRQRTGIMIFISFFEHEVIVMADKGISKMVDQKEWDKLVAGLIDHIRRDKVVEGLEASIKRCGEILLEKGFVKTPDDINELRDDLRVE
jgi:putative membrane protein